MQQLALLHPDVRKMLGLPNKAPVAQIERDEIVEVGEEETNESGVGRISVQNLSPKELVVVSDRF